MTREVPGVNDVMRGITKSTTFGRLVQNEVRAGSAIACRELLSCNYCGKNIDRMILTGRRMDVNVLFEMVERVNVVIKFPKAKLDSVAGIERCKAIS